MLRWALLVFGAMAAGLASAQVEVKEAWARPAVQGQSGTGAFMTITAPQGAKLVGASSPVAGVTEIHEMAMEGNVMKMRAIPFLDLPAGRAVELKPGGYHVMLMDLKQPLKIGEKVKIDFRLELADGKKVTQPIEVEVRSHAPTGTRASEGASQHKH